MWLCLNNGFVSVVKSETNPNILVVRSRRLEDLENVIGKGKVILTNVGTDYKYRTEISRNDLKEILSEKVDEITYTNFKSSVLDKPLHSLYVLFWQLHRKYQR